MRHVISSESSAGFLARITLSAGEKLPFYLLKCNMCTDLVQRLGVKKKLSAKCFREGTKVKKVKNDKKRIVCGFHFKEHHFKRESDRETLRISGRFTTKG